MANLTGQAKPGLVPTNNVTTADGVTVRTRIDPTLTVEDVMKQLCVSLKIKEPPLHFALRDETDELVTNDNLRKKIKSKVNLKYVCHFLFSRSLPEEIIDLSMLLLARRERLQKNYTIETIRISR